MEFPQEITADAMVGITDLNNDLNREFDCSEQNIIGLK